ncbi:hypothetical protein GCM10007108_08420 [Thermogymnomonas acidicola]|uniref:precorrin-2 dehydrogenase n=1 Tax=Thermogymnomonas acidicola TaxID=399579 RepID=A0AA37BR52_9ARCH|nr:NAD(P)-dependent oxidoreductase [Thermogymnomonas acidicola]GGM72612.1 hypothetical protein GCM10007108_08420 [Thermogymnomonas acidicola]
MAYLPLMLDVGGRRAVVFGLNALTAQRIRQLLDAGAVVDLYVPGVEGVGSVVEDVRGAVRGAAIVVVHTGRADLDRAIAVVCREKGIPCNTVDSLDGSVVFPAVSRHGNLTVSVSTDGLVPSLSVHIRDRIDSEVQVASRALPVLAFTRERIREMGLNTRPLMRDILSDSRFWAMVEAGRLEDAREFCMERVRQVLHERGKGSAPCHVGQS